MNKTITISGQTIELPFTEAEYHHITKVPLEELVSSMKADSKGYGVSYDAGLIVGLYLAEKAREDEIEQLKEVIKTYKMGLKAMEDQCAYRPPRHI